jgi:hypothetical protein
MSNFYYYSFYEITNFIKRISVKGNNIIESGCAFLTFCMVLNFLLLVMFVRHFFLISFPISRLTSAAYAIPLWLINRYFLVVGGKGKNIIEHFTLNKPTHLKSKRALLLLYVLASIAAPIVLAYFARRNLF